MHETDWIARFIAPLVTAPGADGLRDDVAVLTQPGVMIATMDTLVEGVHFLADDPLWTVGQKLVRVNVSDILAKGAAPHEALLAITWPAARGEDMFAELMAGIGRDLGQFAIELIGGDLTASNGPLVLTLTLTGRCLGAGPVRRSGARPGDSLYVSGVIGWGALGLQSAKAGRDDAAAAAYRVPQLADLDAAQVIAAHAHASMDVSDGLLLDAARMGTASGCGVRIHLDKVALAHPTDSLEAVLAQCTGGDDYVVLVAAPPRASLPGFTPIGDLVAGSGLHLFYWGDPVNTPETLGFEH